jgi:hypothetical protein
MSHTRNTKIKKIHDQWCLDNGYKLQASSFKPQADPDDRHKRQAPSTKVQASSPKRQAP